MLHAHFVIACLHIISTGKSCGFCSFCFFILLEFEEEALEASASLVGDLWAGRCMSGVLREEGMCLAGEVKVCDL